MLHVYTYMITCPSASVPHLVRHICSIGKSFLPCIVRSDYGTPRRTRWWGNRGKESESWRRRTGGTGRRLSSLVYLSIYLIYLWSPSIIYHHLLSIYLRIYISWYLFIYLSIYLPIYLSIYLFTYLSVYLCMYVSIYPRNLRPRWRG